MPLECVMFCLDTSSYMRNGDLHPTRLNAQQQAITGLSQYKLDDNAESSIGLLTMAGHKVDVKISPSRERHKLLNAMKTLQPLGANDIQASLRIAQLTLRNRSNPHQRPRIVMFIASPINLTDEQITQSGKELKKSNIALDIVLFGYESLENGNFDKAKSLIDSVQNSGNSRLVVHYDPTLMDLSTLPTTTQAHIVLNVTNATLADVVIRSALGRNIQPAAPAPAPVPRAPVVTNVSQTNLGPAAAQGTTATLMGDDEEEIDEDLLAAMALSQMEYDQAAAATTTPQTTNNTAPVEEEVVDDDDDEMDPELLAAIQLSLQEEAEAANQEAAAKEAKKDEEDGDDFNALLEAVSGGVVKKDEEKKD